MKNIGLRPFRRVTMAAAIALVMGGFADAQAQACEDVSGAWSIDLTFPGNPSQTVTVTLEQSDCGVEGTIVGNNETAIEGGTVEGSTFKFTTTVPTGDGGTLAIAWEGTVDGDAVAGTLTADMLGVIEFTGKRAD